MAPIPTTTDPEGSAFGLQLTSARLHSASALNPSAFELHPAPLPTWLQQRFDANGLRPGPLAAYPDIALVNQFLSDRTDKPTTKASYSANLRRLDYFATRYLGLPSFRCLNRDHHAALLKYLQEPPADHIMAKSVSVADPGWRPFRKALSPESARHAMGIIDAFLSWMAIPPVGALPFNPFAMIRARAARRSETDHEHRRYLPEPALRHLLASIDEMPTPDLLAARHQARARWLVNLALMSGLRASEIAAAQSSMLRASPAGAWELHIHRKGDVRAFVPIAPQLMTMWRSYCQVLGLPPDCDVALVGQLDDRPVCGAHGRHLTRQHLWRLFRGYCHTAAGRAKAHGDDASWDLLSRASTHWARHSFGTMVVSVSGNDLRSARELLDHANIATTSMYTHVDTERRNADLAKAAARFAELASHTP